ncbi:MAG: hypothetical protein V3V13_01075 [Paracoccaceae bacterium]
MALKPIIAGLLGAVTMLATHATAGTVTIISEDGSRSISGELISYADGNYVINTAIGEMVFASDTVVCEGESCLIIIMAKR